MTMIPFDRAPFSAGAFVEDLRWTASMISAPFDERVVGEVMSVFAEDLPRCVVQLKTGSNPADGLYFRFFVIDAEDLIVRADGHGLRRNFRPERLDAFQTGLVRTCPHASQAGLDFDCASGLTKLWTYLGHYPLDELAQLPFLPESVGRHRQFFARHGLVDCFFTAVDYRRETINLYTYLDPVHRTTSWLEELLADSPSRPELFDTGPIMAALRVGACVGLTFSWDDRNLRRWAVYGLNAYHLLDPAARPGLPMRVRTFLDSAPTLSREPHVNVAWSIEPTGCVVKIEKSYANTLPASAPAQDPRYATLTGAQQHSLAGQPLPRPSIG